MKRRSEDAPPMRVYAFGAMAPTEGAEAVEDQMFAAHRYRNELAAIEQARRGAYRAITGEVADIAELEARIKALDAERKAINAEAKRRSAEARARVPMAPSERVRKAELSAEIKALRAAKVEARKNLKDPLVLQRIEEAR